MVFEILMVNLLNTRRYYFWNILLAQHSFTFLCTFKEISTLDLVPVLLESFQMTLLEMFR